MIALSSPEVEKGRVGEKEGTGEGRRERERGVGNVERWSGTMKERWEWDGAQRTGKDGSGKRRGQRERWWRGWWRWRDERRRTRAKKEGREEDMREGQRAKGEGDGIFLVGASLGEACRCFGTLHWQGTRALPNCHVCIHARVCIYACVRVRVCVCVHGAPTPVTSAQKDCISVSLSLYSVSAEFNTEPSDVGSPDKTAFREHLASTSQSIPEWNMIDT